MKKSHKDQEFCTGFGIFFGLRFIASYTVDMLKARTIINYTKELAAARILTVAFASTVSCAQFAPNWVDISDYQSSGISREYTQTSSVHSVRGCHLTEEVKLRMMMVDSAKSYFIVALIVEKYHLAPRHKYKKDENNPIILCSYRTTYIFHWTTPREDLKFVVMVPLLCRRYASP